MAIATADRNDHAQDGKYLSLPMKASDTIYRGTLVTIDAAGWAGPASTGSDVRFVGVAQEQKTNGSTAGAVSVLVRCDQHVARFAASGITQLNINARVYAEDDQTVSGTSGTNRRIVGMLIRFLDSATEVDVLVRPEIS